MTVMAHITGRSIGSTHSDARKMIAMETFKLLPGVSQAGNKDLFKDIKDDKDELEESETVLDDC